MGSPRRILFVCTGNICRSPLAEAVLRKKLAERGADDRYEIDSAGTVTDHLGEQADTRMRRTAARRGVRINHVARRVTTHDMERFDLIVGMDDRHLRTLRALAGRLSVVIRKLGEFGNASRAADVPDPWYGGMEGFERVFDMVDQSCEALAEWLEQGS